MRPIIVVAMLLALPAAASEFYEVTAYCPCRKCCGKWAGGSTASGRVPVAGLTVAAPRRIPFGTLVRIEGLGVRRVDDRLAPRFDHRFDLFFRTHAEAVRWGKRKLKIETIKPMSKTKKAKAPANEGPTTPQPSEPPPGGIEDHPRDDAQDIRPTADGRFPVLADGLHHVCMGNGLRRHIYTMRIGQDQLLVALIGRGAALFTRQRGSSAQTVLVDLGLHSVIDARNMSDLICCQFLAKSDNCKSQGSYNPESCVGRVRG